MCPAVAKTSDSDIVKAARSIVVAKGADGLLLRDVANNVGIKAPSLYKRFADRDALLSAVKRQAQAEFTETLEAALEYSKPAQPKELLIALAYSYRHFAQRHPTLFRLLDQAPDLNETNQTPTQSHALFHEVCEDVVGPESAGAASCCLIGFLHGFCAMEAGGTLDRPERADQIFEFSLKTILSGLRPATS